jgi:hypothetical protein
MTRFHALVLASVLLLLGSMSGVALARPIPAGNLAPQARPLQVAHSYFAVLNAGMRTGDFSSLASVYTANARLIMCRWVPPYISPEKTGDAHGLAAITALYQKVQSAFPGYQWTLLRVNRVSSTRVVSDERARGPGGSGSLESETDFVIKGSKITRLAWSLDLGMQK